MKKNLLLAALFVISFLYAGIVSAAVTQPSAQVKNGPDLFTQKLSINEENGLTLTLVNYGDLPVTIDKAKIYNDLQENNQNFKNQLIGIATVVDGTISAGGTKTVKIANLPKMPAGRKYYQIRLYSTDKKANISNMVLSMVAILTFNSNQATKVQSQQKNSVNASTGDQFLSDFFNDPEMDKLIQQAQNLSKNSPSTQVRYASNPVVAKNTVTAQKQHEANCANLLLELNNIFIPSLERRHATIMSEGSKGIWTDCSWLRTLKSYQIQEYNSYIINFNKLQATCNFDGVKETSKAKALMDQECIIYQQAKCQTPMTCN